MKRITVFALSILGAVFTSPAARAQSTVTVTHSDGSAVTFTVPVDMEQSFARYMAAVKQRAIVRAAQVAQTTKTDMVAPDVDETTGDLVQTIVTQFWRGLVQKPEFQPDAMRAKSDAAKAAQTEQAAAAAAVEQQIKSAAQKTPKGGKK